MPSDQHPHTSITIDVDDGHQVVAWCHRLKCTEDQLRSAVGSVGTNFTAVEQWIKWGRLV